MMIKTAQDAAAALKALGMTQLQLADELRRMTGGAYHPQTVTKWFNSREPSDACKVYLTLKTQAIGRGGGADR